MTEKSDIGEGLDVTAPVKMEKVLGVTTMDGTVLDTETTPPE